MPGTFTSNRDSLNTLLMRETSPTILGVLFNGDGDSEKGLRSPRLVARGWPIVSSCHQSIGVWDGVQHQLEVGHVQSSARVSSFHRVRSLLHNIMETKVHFNGINMVIDSRKRSSSGYYRNQHGYWQQESPKVCGQLPAQSRSLSFTHYRVVEGLKSFWLRRPLRFNEVLSFKFKLFILEWEKRTNKNDYFTITISK